MAQDAAGRVTLEGKTAVVTGAGRGIGRTLALALAAAGARVVAAARSVDELEHLCDGVRVRGGEAYACPVDLERLATIERMVEFAVERLGRLDVLVNNAGTSRRLPALDFPEGDWDRIFDTNVKGLFFCSQAAGRVMRRQGGGKIVNVASALAFVASEDLAAYCTSKAAVVHLTRALALEWAKYRINVNAIAPTTTATPMMAQRLADPEVHAAYARTIPMGRVGAPDDLVGAALFLAGTASDFMTGQTLVVDGGFTLR